jgi:hypothetical protein
MLMSCRDSQFLSRTSRLYHALLLTSPIQKLREHYRDLLRVQLWLLVAWVVKLDRRQLLVLCRKASLKALVQVRRGSEDKQVDQYNQSLVEAESSLGVKHQDVKHQAVKPK